MFDDKIIWTRSVEDWHADVKVFGKDLAAVLHLPCIRTQAIAQPVIPEISSNQRVTAVFGSVKGVQYSLANSAVAALLRKASRILAFGPKTASSLKQHGFDIETNPQWRGMSDLVEHLIKAISEGEIIVAPGPKVRAFDFTEFLDEKNIEFIPIDVYETLNGLRGSNDELLVQDDIDRFQRSLSGIVCFASPSAVTGFTRWLNPELFGLKDRLRIMCIGETTRREASEHFEDCLICPEQSTESLFSVAFELLSPR
jgi:uroporphyrinogen-III synthase